ncbi:hypothetical protein [Campylobacter magnus]|uniref:hypothetical protein n=1 Tax=Campylobacter magnus TaxID=3026462 RepID=UPI0026DEE380|nr:hypothetical protein [Campylobacter magnus]MDO2408339.1 hypothetical protein [Campylobacter magnus]
MALPWLIGGAILAGAAIIAACSDDDDKEEREAEKRAERERQRLREEQAAIKDRANREQMNKIKEYICDEFDAYIDSESGKFKSKELKSNKKVINKLQAEKDHFLQLKRELEI